MRWKNFNLQFRSSSATAAKVSDTRPKQVGQNICNENHSNKGRPNREARKPKCANCKGPHVASYKGCPEYKNKHSGNMWSITKKHMPPLSAKTLFCTPKTTNETFTFTAEIAQSQVCYPNPKQDTLDVKSSMCRKV